MGNIKFTAFYLDHRHAQGNITNKYFDLSIFFLIGGHLWKGSIPSADSILFLVDADDPIRFAKANAKLDVRISYFFFFVFYLKNYFFY
jgi:hypothetical protein